MARNEIPGNSRKFQKENLQAVWQGSCYKRKRSPRNNESPSWVQTGPLRERQTRRLLELLSQWVFVATSWVGILSLKQIWGNFVLGREFSGKKDL